MSERLLSVARLLRSRDHTLVSICMIGTTRMVTMTIKVQVPPNKRHELFQTLQSLAESTRSRKGCVNSNIYTDTENEGSIYLVEEWATRSELDDHLVSRNFAVLFGALNLLHGKNGLEVKLLNPAGDLETIEAIRRSRFQ